MLVKEVPEDHGVSGVFPLVVTTCRRGPCLVFDAPIFHQLSAIDDFQNLTRHSNQNVSNINSLPLLQLFGSCFQQLLIRFHRIARSHPLTLIVGTMSPSWWRHQMETFSALLAICAGNSPVPGEFPTQMPVTRNFDVFFDLRPNKRLSKQWWGWWFEMLSCPLWRHSNDDVAQVWQSPNQLSNTVWLMKCDISPPYVYQLQGYSWPHAACFAIPPARW